MGSDWESAAPIQARSRERAKARMGDAADGETECLGLGPSRQASREEPARADTWISGWHGEDAKGNTEDRKGLAPSTPPKSQGENAHFHPCYSPCQWPESS